MIKFSKAVRNYKGDMESLHVFGREKEKYL